MWLVVAGVHGRARSRAEPTQRREFISEAGSGKRIYIGIVQIVYYFVLCYSMNVCDHKILSHLQQEELERKRKEQVICEFIVFLLLIL